MIIKRLDWDSNFFGYEVGKISLESDKVNLNDVFYPRDDFKLIYVESKVPIYRQELSSCYANITYSKQIERDTPVNVIKRPLTAEKYSGDATEQMLRLTYQSGVYSRFKLDENFKNNEYEKLYKKWIENSLNGKIADLVEVVKIESKIMAFVTIKFKTNVSEIGLIAVDNKSRGLGLGTLLLDKVSEIATNKGSEKVLVSTQKDNKLACRFYEKNRFSEFETKYIYHWWTNL